MFRNLFGLMHETQCESWRKDIRLSHENWVLYKETDAKLAKCHSIALKYFRELPEPLFDQAMREMERVFKETFSQ